MCGIAGEIRLDGGMPDVAAVARITEAMHRRGPDGSGVHAAGSIALGHRRLKIIDLSERGGQPMVDAELGLAAVFNGCIYNYRELRAELEGAGLPLLLPLRHRGAAQGVPPLGRGVRRAVPTACSRSPSPSATPACSPSAATGSGIKPLYLAETPEPASGSPARCPRCSRAATSTPRSTRSRCTTT